MEWVAVLIGAFALGSIPVGYLFTKAKGIDIRKVGSGNVGATNVKRALGAKAGYTVFLLDLLKGFIPAALATYVFQHPEFLQSGREFGLVAGLVAVLGHCFSPFLGFRGGKGVATGLGMLFGATPLVAASAFGLFIVFLALTRYVSLSSLVAAIALPVFGFLYGDSTRLIAFYGLLTFIVFARHTQNIGRLLKGTESKFSVSSKEPPSLPAEPNNTDVEEEAEGAPQ